MKIYLDGDFKCHTSGDGTMIDVETDAFDGKCQAYIEGYRFVPSGYTWIRDDGTVFTGEMLSPWKPWNTLDAAQREYERQRVSELEAENETLLNDMAQMVEEVYQSDIETLGI